MLPLTDFQMYSAAVGNLLACRNFFLRENIHDRELCVGDQLSAFFREIQHGRIGMFKGWPCHPVVFLFIGSIQADGNAVNHLCQIRYNIPLVIEIA